VRGLQSPQRERAALRGPSRVRSPPRLLAPVDVTTPLYRDAIPGQEPFAGFASVRARELTGESVAAPKKADLRATAVRGACIRRHNAKREHLFSGHQGDLSECQEGEPIRTVPKRQDNAKGKNAKAMCLPVGVPKDALAATGRHL